MGVSCPGGVACNQLVKQRLGDLAQAAGLELIAPPPRLCTDNGVMVAWAGIERCAARLNFQTLPASDVRVCIALRGLAPVGQQ